MFSATQRLSAARELKRYGQARQLSNAIEFTFDWCGGKVTAEVDLRGNVSCIKRGNRTFASSSQIMPISPAQVDVVDGAIDLAVRVHCADKSCLEVA